jgi:ribosomal protein S18 acetylase RimI-like enzyme
LIQLLNHNNLSTSTQIWNLFQLSYPVEAELLGAKKFPPLSRSISAIQSSNHVFYGLIQNELPVAVIEVKLNSDSLHIQSLVVNPSHFRKGIGKKMIEFILNTYQTVSNFSVETGKENHPARKLYEGFGFRVVAYYLAEERIIKVRYEMASQM